MPYATTRDGVRLYYEETGSGEPIIFVHEFAGDWRSWEPQVRHLSRRYRCITYSARGYHPSDVPSDPAMYSQAHARDDIAAVLDHLDIDSAHVCGLSMGGFATLHFGIAHGHRARSLLIAGCGYGAAPDAREGFQAEWTATADSIRATTMAEVGRSYALGPTRVQFQNKDPRGWQEFADRLCEHSSEGSELTLRGVQLKRPSLWELQDEMRAIDVPTLIVTGDEDDACLEAGILMKRSISSAGLVVVPLTGHTVNLEEPDAFNRILLEFVTHVDGGRWPTRDPRSVAGGLLGRV